MKRWILVLALFALVGAPTGSAAPRDNLSLHDKAAIGLSVYKHHNECMDCEFAPNLAAAKWRFVSNFHTRYGTFAYATVSYKRMNGTQPTSMLFGFDYFPDGGKWRYLGKAFAGGRFSCGAAQLLNPNGQIDVQIRMIKKIARCS